MKAKRLTILILISYAVHFCWGQVKSDSKPPKSLVETKVISQYVTFNPSTNFELFEHRKGLPIGEIRNVTQANDGYVWISIWDYGLVRYDGSKFRSLEEFTGGLISMPSKHIMNVAKSYKNGFWLIANDGIIWFDLKTYRSKIINKIPKQVFETTLHWGCLEDKHGRLWVFGKGIFIYDPLTEEVEEISKINAVDGVTGKTIDISKHFFDNNNYQPVLTRNGVFWITGLSATSPLMISVDSENKKITSYSAGSKYFVGGITQLVPDPGGKYIWTVRLEAEPFAYGGSKKYIARYNLTENKWLLLSFNEETQREKAASEFLLSHIVDGKLWATRGNTIRVIDTKTFHTQIHIIESTHGTLQVHNGVNFVRWLWNNHELFRNFSNAIRFTKLT